MASVSATSLILYNVLDRFGSYKLSGFLNIIPSPPPEITFFANFKASDLETRVCVVNSKRGSMSDKPKFFIHALRLLTILFNKIILFSKISSLFKISNTLYLTFAAFQLFSHFNNSEDFVGFFRLSKPQLSNAPRPNHNSPSKGISGGIISLYQSGTSKFLPALDLKDCPFQTAL